MSADPPRRSTRLVLALALVAAVAYAADQLTKAWVVATLTMGEPHPLIGDLLRLRRTSNPGAAFSLATNATWVLTIIAIVVIIATIWAARRLRSRGWAAALGLLIGGALGNLTDRFFRAPGGGHGHVVDFLQLPNWPIFNMADISIVSAAALICVLAFRGINIDGTRISDTDKNDTDRGDDDQGDDDLAGEDEDPKDRAIEEPGSGRDGHPRG